MQLKWSKIKSLGKSNYIFRWMKIRDKTEKLWSVTKNICPFKAFEYIKK